MYHWSGRVPRAGSSRRDGASTGADLLRYQVELAALRRPTAMTAVTTTAKMTAMAASFYKETGVQ